MYFLRWLNTAGINPVALRRMKGFVIKYIKLCDDPDCYISMVKPQERRKKNYFPLSLLLKRIICLKVNKPESRCVNDETSRLHTLCSWAIYQKDEFGDTSSSSLQFTINSPPYNCDLNVGRLYKEKQTIIMQKS